MTAATKTAKAKATALHSKIVRARGYCENCGAIQNLQCAHIVSRRYSATRTREDNAFCLCAKCHMHFTEWPVEFARFTCNKISVEAYESLKWASLNDEKPDWDHEVLRLTAAWQQIEAAA